MIWLVPTGPLGANDMRETNAKPTVSSQMLSSTAGPALPGLMPLAPRGPLGANRIISNAQLHRWSLPWGFNKKKYQNERVHNEDKDFGSWQSSFRTGDAASHWPIGLRLRVTNHAGFLFHILTDDTTANTKICVCKELSHIHVFHLYFIESICMHVHK